LFWIGYSAGGAATAARNNWYLGAFLPNAGGTATWVQIATGAVSTAIFGAITVAASSSYDLVITKAARSSSSGINMTIHNLGGIGWNTLTTS